MRVPGGLPEEDLAMRVQNQTSFQDCYRFSNEKKVEGDDNLSSFQFRNKRFCFQYKSQQSVLSLLQNQLCTILSFGYVQCCIVLISRCALTFSAFWL